MDCPPKSNVNRCTEKQRDLLPNLRESEAVSEEAIPHSEIVHTDRDLTLVQSLEIPHTPVIIVLKDANLIENAHSLIEVLNSPTPFDNEPSRSEISYSHLQKLSDSRYQSTESTASGIQESEY